MALYDVDIREEEDEVIVVFHGIENEEDKERIGKWVNRLVNQEDEDDGLEDEELFYDPSIGTRCIIPEGKYRGLTIEDAYNKHGHYALSRLLQDTLKMKFPSFDLNVELYKECVYFTIPYLRQKDIELSDFIQIYRQLLKEKTPGAGKEVEDWLEFDEAEQEFIYDQLVSDMVKRMKESVRKFEGMIVTA